MPIDKGRLTKKPVELEFEWEGERCRIVYNRRAITYNSMQDAASFSRAASEGTDLERGLSNVGFTIRQLKQFLLEWDLTENGKPVKITEQEMGGFDPDFLVTMLNAILEDVRPPNSDGPVNSDGSTSQAKESEEN